MSFTFFANYNFGRKPSQRKPVSGRSPTAKNAGGNSTGDYLKEDRILTLRVNALREKHKDDPEILRDLANKINCFLLNITISRDMGSKEQEKNLRREFSDYLNTL